MREDFVNWFVKCSVNLLFFSAAAFFFSFVLGNDINLIQGDCLT